MNLRYAPRDGVLVLDVPQHEWARRSLVLKAMGARVLKPSGGVVSTLFPATLIAAGTLYGEFPSSDINKDASFDRWFALETERQRWTFECRAPIRKDGDDNGQLTWWRDEKGPVTEPYHHQWTGTSWLIASRRSLLLDDMGLGKTKEAIDAACYLMDHDEVEGRVVVVCPNSVKQNWANEISRHGWPPKLPVIVPDGRTWERQHQIEATSEGWIILNYESLRYFQSSFHAACKGAILIVDEAHRCKNREAKQTQAIATARPERLWMLTGTPIANRLDDLWSLCHIVRPGLMGWTYWHFANRHIVYRERRGQSGQTFRETIGFKDVETVRDRLAQIAVGRRKEDCLDLPGKVYEDRRIELSEEERSAYRNMQATLRAWFESSLECETGGNDRTMPVAIAQTFATRLLRLRQISDGLVSESAEGGHAWSKALTKLNAVVELWEDAGRRLVVWCAYVPVVDRLAAMFPNGTAWRLHGGIDASKRQGLIDYWGGSAAGVLVAQMDTGGEGLNLQAADLEVFVDVPWTVKQRRQCEDRLHRIGQTRSVTVVDLIAHDTIDDMLLKRLEDRLKVADETMSASMTVREAREMLAQGRKR